MRIRYIIGTFSIVALIATSVIIYRNSYIPFKPLLFEEDIYKNINVDTSFYRNLKFVLAYNKEPFKYDSNGKLLIKRKVQSDKELVYNYTKRALDTAWIKKIMFK